MFTHGFENVPGLPQLFVRRKEDSSTTLYLAKVVDDFLLCGKRGVIDELHQQLSNDFEIGRFITDDQLIFNRLHIQQDNNWSITISMLEFMDSIDKIPLDRVRRKQ